MHGTALRIGLWYTANGAGIALGGLLGYAIGHIKGALASWRYEFIIIGALCCIWGIVIGIFMPDSPVTAKFLNQREKRIAVERLKSNQTGIENKHLKVRHTPTTYLTLSLPVETFVPCHFHFEMSDTRILTCREQGYQVIEAFKDIKTYLLFFLALVGNIPNGGISNFGTLIIKGML